MWAKPAPGPAPDPPGVTPGLLEARAARRDATDGLMAAIERGPEVRAVAESVADHGRRNHFFELLDVTLPYVGPDRRQ